jgi:hypothetical protein
MALLERVFFLLSFQVRSSLSFVFLSFFLFFILYYICVFLFVFVGVLTIRIVIMELRARSRQGLWFLLNRSGWPLVNLIQCVEPLD